MSREECKVCGMILQYYDNVFEDCCMKCAGIALKMVENKGKINEYATYFPMSTKDSYRRYHIAIMQYIYTPAHWRLGRVNDNVVVDECVYDNKTGRDIQFSHDKEKEAICFKEKDEINYRLTVKRWFEILLQVSASYKN